MTVIKLFSEDVFPISRLRSYRVKVDESTYYLSVWSLVKDGRVTESRVESLEDIERRVKHETR